MLFYKNEDMFNIASSTQGIPNVNDGHMSNNIAIENDTVNTEMNSKSNSNSVDIENVGDSKEVRNNVDASKIWR